MYREATPTPDPDPGPSVYTNSNEGFAAFKQNYETLLADGLVVLEATGAYEQRPLFVPPDAVQQELQDLYSRRQDLVEMRKSEKQRHGCPERRW